MFRWCLVFATLAGCKSAAGDRAPDAASEVDASTGDGSAMRVTCTSHFGDGLSADPTFGRLDGYLVSIVDPSSMHGCNADLGHVHLQVQMLGGVYDIAIDVTDETTGVDDVHSMTLDTAMPGGLPWSEGWHTGSDVAANYVTLGVHSTDLPLEPETDLVQALETDLATVNHVSVYTTSYGADGAHLVHWNGNSEDGILVTEPLSGTPHLRLFSFTDQLF